MALTQAQRDAIYADIILGNLDDYASNPDSLIEVMSSEEFKQGLTCGQLSLEKLNYLFAFTMLSIQKALAESKAYAEGLTTALANALNFCNALSPRSGNLLQVDPQPDGSCKFYYGIEPPANLANQYVDPVNGQDSNVGSRASPLRTIIEAIDRLPTGTRATIHLHEGGVHYWKSSERRNFDKNVYFLTYGPQTDVAQATWNATVSGWAWYGWQNSPKARLEFIYDAPFPSEPGKVGGICFEVPQASSANFNGITLVTPSVGNMNNVIYWQGAMSGQGGLLNFTDCAFEVPQWPLFTSSPDVNPIININVGDVTGSANLIDLSSGGKIDIAVYTRPAGTVNPQGLVYNNGTQGTYWATKVTARATAVPTSPNLFANF